MALLTPSNERLSATCQIYADQINANLGMRLFTADVDPQPQTPLDALSEAGFPGYIRLATAGKASSPIKIADGLYAIDVGPFTWTPTGDSDQTVYGWMIVYGSVLWWAGRLAFPIPIQNGVPFTVTLQIQEGSFSLLSGSQ